MAAIKYAKGTKLLIKFGDGATPTEVFTRSCSFVLGNSVQFNASENTSVIPDCDAPDTVGWEVSEITSKRVTFSGGGVLNTPDFDSFYAWWAAGESRNAKVILDVLAADGGRILSGAWKITQMELTGEEGGKVQITATFGSDGAITKTNNA